MPLFELRNHDTHQSSFLTFIDLKVWSFTHIFLGKYLFLEFSRAVLISTIFSLVSIYHQCPRNASILAFKLHLSDSLIPRSEKKKKDPLLDSVSWFLVWKIRSSYPRFTILLGLENL